MENPTISINDNAEWRDGSLHMISWTHPDEGWEPIPIVVDDFLAAAIKGIATETSSGNANWLFFNFEFGRLMIYPSSEDAFKCTRSELVFFQLFCHRIEKETGNYLLPETRKGPDGKVGIYQKRPDDVPEWVDEETHRKISDRKWNIVHRCLLDGKASEELATARKCHAMKIAAFEFGPEEGYHYFLDLASPEFIDGWKKCQQ
jgi:hypothetical protein